MAGSLRVLLVGGPMYEPLYARLPEFEEREGVRVKTDVAPTHPKLNDRIEEGFSSGQAEYDLISTHAKYAPSQKHWLTPLDDDLKGDHLSPFAPRTLELARMEGTLYGVPRNLDVKLLLYRTDLVERPPCSWEGLLGEAALLKDDGKVPYGFAFPGRESGLFGHFFELHAMAGGRMFAGEGPPVPSFDDEAGLWALSMLKGLYEGAAPPRTPEWHYDEVAACFRGGEAAMSTDWPGGFYTYEEDDSPVKGRYGFAPYPKGPAGRFVYSGSHTFAIPTTVRDRPAAIKLLEFLTSRESQLLEARLGTLPARTDSLGDVRAEAAPGSLAEERWGLLTEQSRAALVPPKHERYPTVEGAIWGGLREALLGKDVREALGDTQAAAGRAAVGEEA